MEHLVAGTGRPGKPTTQGKNERLHQTIQRFLDAHRPIRTASRLAALVDKFDDYYNTQRAHQALDPDQTPAVAYQARLKAVLDRHRPRRPHPRRPGPPVAPSSPVSADGSWASVPSPMTPPQPAGPTGGSPHRQDPHLQRQDLRRQQPGRPNLARPGRPPRHRNLRPRRHSPRLRAHPGHVPAGTVKVRTIRPWHPHRQ